MWKAKLDGTDGDLETMAHVFSEGDPTVSRDEEEQWLLSSATFAGLTTASEAHAKAEPLLVQMNGAIRANNPGFRPVRLSSTYIDETKRVVLLGAATIEARAFITGTLTGDTPVPPPEKTWLRLAATDKDVHDILHLVGGGPSIDYSVPYKLIEIVEHSVVATSRL
jgi:hypothetical protein